MSAALKDVVTLHRRRLAVTCPEASALFSALLKSCISDQTLPRARKAHCLILTSGLLRDRFVTNHLINAYAKLGQMASARRVFDEMPTKNFMSWNILIGGFIQNDLLDPARRLFHEMPVRNAAAWNAMVTGVIHFGFNDEGLDLFLLMKRSGFRPDEFALGSVLRGCAAIQDPTPGRQIHAYLIRSGYERDLCVCSSLAHMYMNCGSQADGESVLDAVPASNVVSFNTAIAGRVRNDDAEGAVHHFREMKTRGLVPDHITFTGVLAACAELATIGQSRQIHAQVTRTGAGSFLAVRSSLLNAYSRCGFLRESETVFLESSDSDHVLWTAMISSYGFHGRGRQATEAFDRMVEAGIEPNDVTFLNLLYACSHSGLREYAERALALMRDRFGLEPKLEHYTCMVDLLGRANRLREAKDLITAMPVRADAVIWKTLLASCRRHGDLAMARQAAEQVLLLDPRDSAPYVLLAQAHATSKRWDEALQVREHMRGSRVKKEPGVSWVEVRNEVHRFVSGDKSHPQHEVIYGFLMELVGRMRECGYVPDTAAVLHDMDDEEKELNLIDHSEKLAVAFAIVTTPDWAPIRIMKNLRICSDCHDAIKFISKLTGREIVLRDVSRFHHFQDGDCSCGGFW